jgi:putative transposase
MAQISYRRHRFPPIVIQHAVWLYLRFTLSYRDVEELLAARGLDISYESVRSWVLKFGPAITRALRRCRPRPSDRWHLDEMVVRIAGKHMYLWRAFDHEGEVLEDPGSAPTGQARSRQAHAQAAPQAGLRAAKSDD